MESDDHLMHITMFKALFQDTKRVNLNKAIYKKAILHAYNYVYHE